MTYSQDTRRVYVACLASYNAGRLVGTWLDMEDFCDADELAGAFCAAIKGEEWAIHDYEGWPANTLGEHSSPTDVWELHEALTEHGGEILSACLANFRDLAQALEHVENFAGEADSLGDFAREMHESCGTSLGELAAYIDWDHVALNMDVWTTPAESGGILVFWSR